MTVAPVLLLPESPLAPNPTQGGGAGEPRSLFAEILGAAARGAGRAETDPTAALQDRETSAEDFAAEEIAELASPTPARGGVYPELPPLRAAHEFALSAVEPGTRLSPAPPALLQPSEVVATLAQLETVVSKENPSMPTDSLEAARVEVTRLEIGKLVREAGDRGTGNAAVHRGSALWQVPSGEVAAARFASPPPTPFESASVGAELAGANQDLHGSTGPSIPEGLDRSPGSKVPQMGAPPGVAALVNAAKTGGIERSSDARSTPVSAGAVQISALPRTKPTPRVTDDLHAPGTLRPVQDTAPALRPFTDPAPIEFHDPIKPQPLPVPLSEDAPSFAGVERSLGTIGEASLDRADAQHGQRPLPSTSLQPLAQRAEWLASRGGGVARLRLDPPHLGEVELQVRAVGSEIRISMIADEASARALLDGGREWLIDQFAARDLRVGHFEVQERAVLDARTDQNAQHEANDEKATRQSGGERDSERPPTGGPPGADDERVAATRSGADTTSRGAPRRIDLRI